MIGTIFITAAALFIALIPALGFAVMAVTLTAGFGPDASDRAGKRAVAAFVAGWIFASWVLIEWWVV